MLAFWTHETTSHSSAGCVLQWRELPLWIAEFQAAAGRSQGLLPLRLQRKQPSQLIQRPAVGFRCAQRMASLAMSPSEMHSVTTIPKSASSRAAVQNSWALYSSFMGVIG